MSIELGNLIPLRDLREQWETWEKNLRTRPLADSDAVVQTVATMREQYERALSDAAHIELELSAKQYAALRGWTPNKLYKRWQRGQLPEARMRGGKLVVPVSALTDAAA